MIFEPKTGDEFYSFIANNCARCEHDYACAVQREAFARHGQEWTLEDWVIGDNGEPYCEKFGRIAPISSFAALSAIDVGEFIEKKGRFNYLSWTHAVRTLLTHFPGATWEVHEFTGADGVLQPFYETKYGPMVKVTVTVDGIERSQIHPVLDYQNRSVAEPDTFQINTAIQRCLAKAIALHGLGLYIYAGEDLPPETAQEKEEALAKRRQEIEFLIDAEGLRERFDEMMSRSKKAFSAFDEVDLKKVEDWISKEASA